MAAERRVILPTRGREEAGLWVLGELHTIRARAATYTLVESATPPGGGLPPHVHNTQDEGIYILEGEYALLLSGHEESTMGPGSFASISRGTVHALKKSAGDEMGRCLAFFTPPGEQERFLEEVGVPIVDWNVSLAPPEDTPGMDEVAASARRHGIYLLTRPI